MKTLTLKLDDSILGGTEKILTKIKKSRNNLIEEILKYESKITQQYSLAILK